MNVFDQKNALAKLVHDVAAHLDMNRALAVHSDRDQAERATEFEARRARTLNLLKKMSADRR